MSDLFDDLVERLRWSGQDAMTKHLSLGMATLHAEAADEIERLRAELEDAKADALRLHQEKMVYFDALLEARAHVERLTCGLRSIQEYLDVAPPRIGDASFDCEALLVGTIDYEHGVPSKTSWPRAQEEARKADPRPSEDIMRQERGDWPDATIGTGEEK